MSLYRQLQDYETAMRSYIMAATGIEEDRIIFSTPDIAKRRLKERLNNKYRSTTIPKTIEVDNFISFYIPFVQDQVSTRSSVLQGFIGGLGVVSGKEAYVINLDTPIQIEIWGGPDQRGKQFVFEKQMLLKDYFRRNQAVQVQFRDLETKDPSKPTQKFDVDCWYLLQPQSFIDNSRPEEQYIQGALYRTTVEALWLITFYNMPDLPAYARFKEIVLEWEASQGDPDQVEWVITTSTTTSTTTLL